MSLEHAWLPWCYYYHKRYTDATAETVMEEVTKGDVK